MESFTIKPSHRDCRGLEDGIYMVSTNSAGGSIYCIR